MSARPENEEFQWTVGDDNSIVHVETLDRGANGEVHKMGNEISGEIFARKLIRFHTGTDPYIANETRAIDKLCRIPNNRSTVLVFQHGFLKNSPFYFIDMELCDLNLNTFIYTETPPEFMARLYCPETGVVRGNVAWKVLEELAQGLDFIHRASEVHRDIKPGNDGVWKIADFGITAEGTSRRANTTRDGRGTSGYRAPELCQDLSTYNNKVDMWAYGCIAYELLARKRAFEGDWQIMQYALEGGKTLIQLKPNSAIEEATMACLNFIVKATLRVDPRLRPSATAILQLMNCCVQTIVEMVPTEPKSPQLKYCRQEYIDWAEVHWLEYCSVCEANGSQWFVQSRPSCALEHSEGICWRLTSDAPDIVAPTVGPLSPDIDESDDDELVHVQFPPVDSASGPASVPPVPFYQPGPRGSWTTAPIVNPNALVLANSNGQMMFNPSSQMITSLRRPYSYATDQFATASMYPNLDQDLLVLSTVAQMQSTKKVMPLVDILVQRTPTEIETIRRHFRTMNGGTDLSVGFKNLLNTSYEQASVKYALTGLVLGPVLYDLWLLQNLDEKDEEILIDIFIGRASEDIQYFLFKFQQHQQGAMIGKTISSTLAAVTSNKILQRALDIATESIRPDGTYPVDPPLVQRDVEEISKILNTAFPSNTTDLLNILLRRSDIHIMQLNLQYRLKNRDRALDEEIRRATGLPTMMRKIAVHAVRSATDLTYRDVIALREPIVGNGSDERLAIRICRLHWYKQHWKQVKAGYFGLMGQELVDKVCGHKGLLRELLVAICFV